MKFLREHYEQVGAVVLVIGILLVTVAEMPSMHWTRVFGAGAVSIGAIAIGAWIGAARPKEATALRERLGSIRTPIAALVAAVTFLPALLGLAAGFAGLASEPSGTGWVIVVGAVMLALMLVATIIALAVTVQAIMVVDAGVPQPEGGSAE